MLHHAWIQYILEVVLILVILRVLRGMTILKTGGTSDVYKRRTRWSHLTDDKKSDM